MCDMCACYSIHHDNTHYFSLLSLCHGTSVFVHCINREMCVVVSRVLQHMCGMQDDAAVIVHDVFVCESVVKTVFSSVLLSQCLLRVSACINKKSILSEIFVGTTDRFMRSK